MKIRPSLIESAAIAGFFVLGLMLRTWHLDREAVEHFDEGIYASVLWHDGAFNAPYPARDFYAPPMLSTAMEFFSVLPGLSLFAPFLPAIVSGLLSILALWWLARAWFGRPAGIFIAAVVALSDFHVIYSRMAMTDVPCLLWIIASVYLGTLAVQKQSFLIAAMSGFVCGLAWWTKYTGWLPLAIVSSGTVLWWLWVGRKQITAVRTLLLLATIGGTAILTFSPWWWHLQAQGGYAAVSANHASYIGNTSMWLQNLTAQLTFQFWLDGMFGAVSLGLGMAAAGIYRWLAAECSTWNTLAAKADRPDSVGPAAYAVNVSSGLPYSHATDHSWIPLSLLLRFLMAAAALTVIALRIWTPLMLICISLGGFGGMFLWPVLNRLWQRSVAGDTSPTSDGSLPLCEADLQSAASIDPTLGLCTTLTWFVGLLLVTPLYHPYSRLFFPLLAAVWLAAAGGVGWWLESNVSVARRMVATGSRPPSQTWGQRLVSIMLTAAVLSSFVGFDEAQNFGILDPSQVFRSSLWQNRSSITFAAAELVDDCVLAARGKLQVGAAPVVPIGETITPEAVLKAVSVPVERASLSEDERRRERLVVYVYGEPALCFQLAAAGIVAVPVSHLNLSDPDGSEPDVPTFLVIGPNAKRTPGFWEEWMQRVDAFESVTNVDYYPSEVTLLDLFSVKWRNLHDEVTLQTFELHRVR